MKNTFNPNCSILCAVFLLAVIPECKGETNAINSNEHIMFYSIITSNPFDIKIWGILSLNVFIH